MRILTGFSIWLGTAVACFAGEKESRSLQGRPVPGGTAPY